MRGRQAVGDAAVSTYKRVASKDVEGDYANEGDFKVLIMFLHSLVCVSSSVGSFCVSD